MNKPTPKIPLRQRFGIATATICALGVALMAVAAFGIQSANAQTKLVQPQQLAQEPDDSEDPADFGDAYDEFDRCADAIWGDDEADDNRDLDDAAIEALDQRVHDECVPLLPADEQAFVAAFGPFEACIDQQLAAVEEDGVDLFESDDAEIDALFEAAEQACESELPQEFRDLEAALQQFDQCLVDNGVVLEDEFGDFDDEFDDGGHFAGDGAIVIIEGPSTEQFIELGEAAATVTITSADGAIDVVTSGDAAILEIGDDFGAEDAAFETCERLLPDESAFFGGALEEGEE